MIEYLVQIDEQLFLFLNGLHNSFMDTVMWQVSGKFTWAPLYLLLIGLMIRKVGLKKAAIAFGFVILALVLSDMGSVHFFKNVFMRLRPCHDPNLEGLVHIVNNKCGGQFGFISSHASNTFMAAMFFTFFFKNKFATLFLILWAVLVSYSRVYLGVHFPGDVIGGAIWGTFSGVLFYYCYRLVIRKVFRD